MASIAAPKLDDTLPATPAHEWANETSSKLADTSATTTVEERPPMVAVPSTPGVPGSYPRDGVVAESATEGAGIFDMAKQYLPGQDDVQGVLKQATETAKTYLPTSVAAYLPGGASTTLPSQDGAQKPMEHSDGVGALPGNASETSVAKLPHEDEPIRIAGNAVVHDITDLNPPKVNNIAELTPATNGKPLDDDVSVASIKAQYAETPAVLTPGITSASTNLATKPTGGVGDLPGHKSESGVAVLPDEKHVSNQTGISSATTNLSSKPVDGVGDLPGNKSESGVAVLPGEKDVSDSTNHPINLSGRLHPLAAEGVEWEGTRLGRESETKMDVDMDHRLTAQSVSQATLPAHKQEAPAHATLPQSDVSPARADASKFAEASGHKNIPSQDLSTTASAGSTGTDGSRSVGGTPRKPKLMEKLKGEMKIISGKLGGDEDKVEEGKRLMGKV